MAVATTLIAAGLAFYPQLGLGPGNQTLINVTDFLRPCFVGLLAVALAQEDLVITDRAAWITRPIRPAAVLGAKVLFLLMLVVFPLGLIASAASAQFAIDRRGAIVLGLLHGAEQLFQGTICLVIGGLAPSFTGAIVGLALGWGAIALLQPYLGNWAQVTETNAIFSGSNNLLGAVLIIAALGCHYAYRQVSRTLLALAVAAVPILVYPHLRLNQAVPGTNPASIAVTARNRRGFIGAALQRSFPMRDRAVVGLEIALPNNRTADYGFYTRTVRFAALNHPNFEITAPETAPISTYRLSSKSIYTTWNNLPRLVQERFGVPLEGNESEPILSLFALDGGTLKTLAGTTGTLDVTLAERREVILFEVGVPAQPEAKVTEHGYRFEIESTRYAGNAMQLGYRVIHFGGAHSTDNINIALENPQTDEVSFAEFSRGESGSAQSFLMWDNISSCRFAHRWSRLKSEPPAELDADWLKAARLRFFVLHSQPSGVIDLAVPQFEMPPTGGVQ